MYVFAYFCDHPGSEMDKAAHSIMAERGGQSIGAGTDLMTGERDVQFRFESEMATQGVKIALERAGFRVEIRPLPAAADQESARSGRDATGRTPG